MKTLNFNIKKTYEGRPSKNHITENNLSFEDAVSYLDLTARQWRKNGGIIVSESQTEIVCGESDDSEQITFTIEENKNYF